MKNIDSKLKLKLYHKLIPIFTLPICLFIAGKYFWIGFATLTQRPGINGFWYFYYNVSREFYSSYELIVSSIALTIFFMQLFFIFKSNPKKLGYMFWILFLFIILLIFSEYLLSLRFTPKG